MAAPNLGQGIDRGNYRRRNGITPPAVQGQAAGAVAETVFFGTATGAVTHATTGALTGQIARHHRHPVWAGHHAFGGGHTLSCTPDQRCSVGPNGHAGRHGTAQRPARHLGHARRPGHHPSGQCSPHPSARCLWCAGGAGGHYCWQRGPDHHSRYQRCAGGRWRCRYG